MIMTAIITLPVVSTAPSMAEGHTSIEPAGGAEKAHTARPEALTATACDGSGPNEDHLRTALVTVVKQLWGGQPVVSHTQEGNS